MLLYNDLLMLRRLLQSLVRQHMMLCGLFCVVLRRGRLYLNGIGSSQICDRGLIVKEDKLFLTGHLHGGDDDIGRLILIDDRRGLRAGTH